MIAAIRRLDIRKSCLILFACCIFIVIIFHSWSHERNSTSDTREIRSKYSFKYDDHFQQIELPSCPPTPPNRRGEFTLDLKEEPLEHVEQRLSLLLHRGGWFSPKECKARDRVAIIVPAKEREYMYPIFLKNLHMMLMKQQIEYGIYIIEQPAEHPDFNKGVLFNAGFTEAMKMKDWDCFIFHDVDSIPFNDRNIYDCPRNSVRHMGVALDKFNYKLLHKNFAGVAIALTTQDYRKINGFSNLFWNWGGEDNDLEIRFRRAGIPLVRPSEKIAKYISLPHRKGSKFNPKWQDQVKQSDKYLNVSGLNSLQYKIKEFKIKPTHVHITLDTIPRENPDMELAKQNGTDSGNKNDTKNEG